MESSKGSFPLLCQRGALTQGHVGKSPHASSLDGSVPLKANCLMPASSEVHCCSLALLALSFSLCSRPPAQVAVVLSLSRHPPGDSWVPGNRIGPPREERRAGTGFCNKEKDVPQAPRLDFSNSAVCYGLGLTGSGLFLVALKQKFQGVSPS